MSNALLGRALRVGLVIRDDSRREALSALLEGLGHEVRLTCSAVESFQEGLAIKPGLEIVLTNLASVDTIRDLKHLLDEAGLNLPLVVVNSDLANLLAVTDVAAVFGCHVYPERSEDLAAVVLIALRRYEAQRVLEGQLAQIQEQLGQAQQVADRNAHAALILTDRYRLTSLEEGYNKLREIARSYNETITKRAERIIAADRVMRPRPPKRNK